MNRLSLTVAITGATIALGGGVLMASAQALTPPAGGPDLGQMTVQLADLAPGASVHADGYVKPETGFTAEYGRTFSGARAQGGGGPSFSLQTHISLASKDATAHRAIVVERGIYNSKPGRRLLAQTIVRGAGAHSHLTVKEVHFGKLERINVGVGSFIETVRLSVKRLSVFADFVVIGVGPVAANLTFIGIGRQLPAATLTRMARVVGAHIAANLPPVGATTTTGTTGVTGTTGTTGATGMTGVT